MIEIHVHVYQPAPAAPLGAGGDIPVMGAAAEPVRVVGGIGDGTILKLIAEYGPKLLALLIQLGVLKLPGGVTFDPAAPK